MVIYFSGEGSPAYPERVFGNRSNIMLSFSSSAIDQKDGTKKRFGKILAARKKKWFPKCIACSGTGISSKETQCIPCEGTGWKEKK